MQTAAKFVLDQVSHVYGDGSSVTPSLAPISLGIPEGAVVSLIGRSGSGKTTLFNIIAGLLHPTSGRVLLDGDDVTGCTGLVGYMLQKDLLLPWRSVIANVALPLELAGVPRSAARARAAAQLPRYGLDGFADARPAALSGGMRQRAALLRTLLNGRSVLLLDEPFGALDAQTRLDMQALLMDVWQEQNLTIVLVTHDIDEAVLLSDQVHILGPRPGRIVASVAVTLPRPRDHATMALPEFARIRQDCLRWLTAGTSV
jgi:ABC-type nitrate/sulfonate/bicarbonate transport system ATPase subunit